MKFRLSLLSTCFAFMLVSQGQTPPPSPPSMQQDSQPASLASSMSKGESKLRGCLRSTNGKYSVESGRLGRVWLSGSEDFAPSVGHTVIVHGSFLDVTAPTSPAPGDPKTDSGASSMRHERNFQVSKIETVSNTCTLKNNRAERSSTDPQ